MSLSSGHSIDRIRRQVMVGAVAAMVSSTMDQAVATAMESHLPTTDSLPRELALALERGHPLLVMVSLDGCPFCKIARENYLIPLQREQGLPIVQIDMRGRHLVQGFNGPQQTQEGLSRSWAIKVAPTVLFFGRGAQEVAERLVGGYLPDFYGAYLDERVRRARASLHS